MDAKSTGQWKLYLFGAPRVERNGQPVTVTLRKALALLIYLAVTRQAHSRDALATLFWPEKNQQGARANLRRTLYDLSQLLDAQLLAVTPETVALSPTADLWLDVERFRQALANHLPATLLTEAVDADLLAVLGEAAAYYDDDFLAGFTLPDVPAFDEWQFFQREELRSACARMLQQVIAIYVAQAQFEEAVHFGRRWLQLDPLEEAVHRQLMQLYAQAGQQAAAIRQYDECTRILAAELDVPPAAETTALFEAIRTRRFPVPDKMTQDQEMLSVHAARPVSLSSDQLVLQASGHPDISAPPHKLPTPNTPFIGRQREIAELMQRLVDPACRLLTLVGPGGIGKTRLALAAARQILDLSSEEILENRNLKDGLFFVPLQPVSAVSGVIPAIADALGFHFYGGTSPQEQLFSYLREKQMLLLLDNFEHLPAAADLVAALLVEAPSVKVLVTSREALKLQEEWFHPLSGLRLPPQAQPASLRENDAADTRDVMIERYDAVQLFVQTARRALVDFDPAQHREAIAHICRLVDGMPLALELVASWLKVLSCTQIADEIAQGSNILITRHQNVPARHRNMRVVMNQSWQL
ncbi:MAG: BTAD domain-containing putative transcriptional regulator [Caldilineaceae bacterium]